MIEGKNILRGVAAASGIVIAKAHLYEKDVEFVSSEEISDVDEAKTNFLESIKKSKKELNKIFGLAVDKLGEKRAAIFEAQIMILDDKYLIDAIFKRIATERKSAEYIVNHEISKYQRLMMNNSSEVYMKERAQDIEDIKNRIIRNIRKKKWVSHVHENIIVVAENITPADAILFSRVKVRGYVTDYGGLTSHAAIVARSLSIPAVLGVHDGTVSIADGDEIIVDGFHGLVVINPTQEQKEYYQEKIELFSQYDEELKKAKDLPSITRDGKHIKILGNLDLIEEIDITIQNGAEGIGLVRTEQIFGDLDNFPEEDEQYQVYKKLAETFYPDNIIIRVYDIGGDKVLPVDVKEPNPFLGWRGVRFLLDNSSLFKTQLKAILRASVTKNIKIMVPMVASIKEVYKFKEILAECKNELRNRNIDFDDNICIGVMIEIPSAAVIAEDLAEEVNFLSIGTNDLIQYLLAVDRTNEIVSDLYQEFHPSVLRTLALIIENAKKKGANVSLCGEMAGDPLAVPFLVGLGLDSLSVSSAVLPKIKGIIRSINYEDAKALARKCLSLKTEEKIKDELQRFLNENIEINTNTIFGE